ncbi:MAG: FAD-binding protein [Desulfovibrionaceae bacterium]|nr:FAD-binding protein [Desulfovibrionaceae bacterium]
MRLVERPSLARLTTLGLGGTCSAALIVEETADLARLGREIETIGLPPYALGLGSNILGLDGHHEMLLVRADLRGEPVLLGEDSSGRTLLSCPAGQPLPSLLAFCRDRGFAGLEGLAGIPGSVGGAVAMNAGSFGSVIGDRLVSADIWHRGRVSTFKPARIEMGYRHFLPLGIKKGFWLLTGCVLALDRDEPRAVAERIEATRALKKERQPVGARSAGCVFKNPPDGRSAGQLLDAAGFRGRRLGGVEMSSMHANFLVNTGSGTATEAVELLKLARAAVADRFGVELALEVRGVPCRCF